MSLISVPAGSVLTVTAEPGGYATVWQEGTKNHWNVGAKAPMRLGAGRYRVETITGKVSHSVDSQAVAVLKATLPRATEIVQSAANIAGAVSGGVMIQDKFKRLAERAKAVPAALSERADDVLSRLDAVENRGGQAFGNLDAVVRDAEAGVTAAEDAVNQLTNGGG